MILVDAHVHIHDCFDLERFFTSTHKNFQSQAAGMQASNNFTGTLLLAESAGENWFEILSKRAVVEAHDDSRQSGIWSFQRTGDDRCLELQSGGEQKLYVMAGRQIVTAEGLEVLALITQSLFADGLPVEDTIHSIHENNAVAVFPWGFGKWRGRRRRVLDVVLSNESFSGIFLGDNGGRAGFLGVPGPFNRPSEKWIKILPGSDPLPFAFEQGRAGSFGFWCNETVSADRPAEDLLRILRNPQVRINPYGKLVKPLPFLFKQVAMQIRKLTAHG
jgi:hypothetical protein